MDAVGSRALGDFLAETAAETPLPGAASSAALSVAVAAALAGSVARRSREGWPDAGGAAAQADALRRRATALGVAASDSYARALELLDAPAIGSDPERDARLGDALADAAAASLRIGEVALDVAELGALAASEGDQSARAEALTAAFLAEAGARSSAAIVAVNLAITRDDERIHQAGRLAERASACARRAASNL